MVSDIGSRLREDHPRLFLHSDTLDDVVRYAKTKESDTFDRMKSRMDRLTEQDLDRGDYGKHSAEAAFLYLATEEKRYLDLARELLVTSLDHYRTCYEHERGVDWFS